MHHSQKIVVRLKKKQDEKNKVNDNKGLVHKINVQRLERLETYASLQSRKYASLVACGRAGS